MFRLANFDDDDMNSGLYRYLSAAISLTIIDCLNEFLGSAGRYNNFYYLCFGREFFSGISQYINPRKACESAEEADDQVGYDFTRSKMKRMKEKMEDLDEIYTFDVFEERILFFMCSIMAERARAAEGKKAKALLKEKVETAKAELREKYGLSAKMANDYSRKMYYPEAMLLKDDEDDNIIFWDDDYGFFWDDGFVKGIDHLKDLEGQNAGYGYHYACDIFSDVGIKPPLMLLGTEEANRIKSEVQNEKFKQKMNEFFGDIMGSKSVEDIKRKYDVDDKDLPFN